MCGQDCEGFFNVLVGNGFADLNMFAEGFGHVVRMAAKPVSEGGHFLRDSLVCIVQKPVVGFIEKDLVEFGIEL